MYAAVFFDLDDTLISDELVSREAAFVTALEVTHDELKAHAVAKAAEQEARAQWHRLPPNLAAYTTAIGHSAIEGLWATYDPRIPEEVELEEQTSRIRVEVWARALAEVGVTRGDPAAMAQRWKAARNQFPLYPDTNEVLAWLRPQTKLAIVTNGVTGLQRRKVDGSGLAHWFDVVAISGEVGIGKPERGIFEWVAKRLDVDLGKCLMVGDNPERDVQGGLNAGMRTCWVDRGLRLRTVKADLEVRNLKQLLPLPATAGSGPG
jgi:putative hydrolase of the HAD superfamily